MTYVSTRKADAAASSRQETRPYLAQHPVPKLRSDHVTFTAEHLCRSDVLTERTKTRSLAFPKPQARLKPPTSLFDWKHSQYSRNAKLHSYLRSRSRTYGAAISRPFRPRLIMHPSITPLPQTLHPSSNNQSDPLTFIPLHSEATTLNPSIGESSSRTPLHPCRFSSRTMVRARLKLGDLALTSGMELQE